MQSPIKPESIDSLPVNVPRAPTRAPRKAENASQQPKLQSRQGDTKPGCNIAACPPGQASRRRAPAQSSRASQPATRQAYGLVTNPPDFGMLGRSQLLAHAHRHGSSLSAPPGPARGDHQVASGVPLLGGYGRGLLQHLDRAGQLAGPQTELPEPDAGRRFARQPLRGKRQGIHGLAKDGLSPLDALLDQRRRRTAPETAAPRARRVAWAAPP